MKYIVYLTTNLKSSIGGTNKIYIGVHKTNDSTVFDGYLGCGVYRQQPSTYLNPKTPFQYAVKKYGPDAFRRVILFEFDTEQEAYEKEKELVTPDFIKQSHVYNICPGGVCNNRGKPIYQFDLKGNLIKKWDFVVELVDVFGYDMSRFHYAIHHKHPFLDAYWSREESIDITEYITGLPHSHKITYLYDKNGKCVREFFSQKECAEFLGVKDISKQLQLSSLINNQYYVSNKLVDEFKPKARAQQVNQEYFVYQNNKLLGIYKGKDLMPIIKVYSWSKIRDIFRYNKGWYKDFYISLEEIDVVPTRTKSNGILVDVYTKYGEFVETLTSIKEVKEKYHVHASKIKNIQLGDRYYENWIFKYHSNSK